MADEQEVKVSKLVKRFPAELTELEWGMRKQAAIWNARRFAEQRVGHPMTDAEFEAWVLEGRKKAYSTLAGAKP